MEHDFLLFYVIDSVVIEKGVCCSRRKYTLDKVCRLTVVETILRSAKVKPAHISKEFKKNEKIKNNTNSEVKQTGVINKLVWSSDGLTFEVKLS